MIETYKSTIWFIFIIGIGLGIFVGCIIGIYSEESNWHRQAIQHNCAQYDSQTGEFMWKEVEDGSSSNVKN